MKLFPSVVDVSATVTGVYANFTRPEMMMSVP